MYSYYISYLHHIYNIQKKFGIYDACGWHSTTFPILMTFAQRCHTVTLCSTLPPQWATQFACHASWNPSSHQRSPRIIRNMMPQTPDWSLRDHVNESHPAVSNMHCSTLTLVNSGPNPNMFILKMALHHPTSTTMTLGVTIPVSQPRSLTLRCHCKKTCR